LTIILLFIFITIYNSKQNFRQSIVDKKEWIGNDTSNPGPGQYNSKSIFDENNKMNYIDYIDNENDVIKRKTASIFKSVVERKFPINNPDIPGPASYTIPSTLKNIKIKDDLQCFSSSTSRFKEVINI
jgi:hypothetical protein